MANSWWLSQLKQAQKKYQTKRLSHVPELSPSRMMMQRHSIQWQCWLSLTRNPKGRRATGLRVSIAPSGICWMLISSRTRIGRIERFKGLQMSLAAPTERFGNGSTIAKKTHLTGILKFVSLIDWYSLCLMWKSTQIRKECELFVKSAGIYNTRALSIHLTKPKENDCQKRKLEIEKWWAMPW